MSNHLPESFSLPTPVFLPIKSHGGAWRTAVPGVAEHTHTQHKRSWQVSLSELLLYQGGVAAWALEWTRRAGTLWAPQVSGLLSAR